MTEAEDIQNYLETEPQTTIEYVNYIVFIDNATEKVDEMETRVEYAKELYDIIEEYKILVHPDEVNAFLNASVTLSTVRSIVDKKNEERPKVVLSFNDQCNKDINKLINDIGKIKERCMVRLNLPLILILVIQKCRP